MNWEEITKIIKPGFKIGLLSWNKDTFWPIDHNGDVLIGENKKLNPELFNSQNWVILIDNPDDLKNNPEENCQERFEKLTKIHEDLIKKLEWFVGPGKVCRNPMLLENFEMFVVDQLKKIAELNKS